MQKECKCFISHLRLTWYFTGLVYWEFRIVQKFNLTFKNTKHEWDNINCLKNCYPITNCSLPKTTIPIKSCQISETRSILLLFYLIGPVFTRLAQLVSLQSGGRLQLVVAEVDAVQLPLDIGRVLVPADLHHLEAGGVQVLHERLVVLDYLLSALKEEEREVVFKNF